MGGHLCAKAERHSVGNDEIEWRKALEGRRKARLMRHSHGGHGSDVAGGNYNREERLTLPDSILQFGLDAHDDGHTDAHADAQADAHTDNHAGDQAGDHADDQAHADARVHVHMHVHMPPSPKAHSQAYSLPSSTRHRDMFLRPDPLAATTPRVRAATLSETLSDELFDRTQGGLPPNGPFNPYTGSSPPRTLTALDTSALGTSPTAGSWLRGNAGCLETMLTTTPTPIASGFPLQGK